MMKHKDNVKGILFNILSMLLLVAMDCLVKVLVRDISVYEVMFYRSIAGLPFFVLIVHFTSGLKSFKVVNWRFQILRGSLGALGMYCFFNSYKYLPMGDAAGIIFSAPIFLTILSVILLKETIGLHRIFAIILGFAGVLFIARPGIGIFNIYTLFPILGALTWCLVVLSMRVLSKTDHANSVTMCFSIIVGTASGIVMLVDGVVAVSSSFDVLLLLGTGIVGTFGQLFMTKAVETCEASVFAATKYINLAFSVLAGFIVFGETPLLTSIIGIICIVLSGLYIVYREQRLKKSQETRAIRP